MEIVIRTNWKLEPEQHLCFLYMGFKKNSSLCWMHSNLNQKVILDTFDLLHLIKMLKVDFKIVYLITSGYLREREPANNRIVTPNLYKLYVIISSLLVLFWPFTIEYILPLPWCLSLLNFKGLQMHCEFVIWNNVLIL